jgi:hypothetical protein
VPASPVSDNSKLELAVVIIQLQAGEGVGAIGGVDAQGVGGAVLALAGYDAQNSNDE